MTVIVGLGNPGSEYEGSRHNAGFLVVAGLADGFRIRLAAGRGDFMSGKGRIAGQGVRLVMPLTYMNASGEAVARVLAESGAEPSDLLVICDDVNLPLGMLRLRERGSDGGHNGLKSIIESLGTSSFARLRLGVGRPVDEVMTDFVLDRFAESERSEVDEMLARSRDVIVTMLRQGIRRAMTAFNRKTEALESEEQ